MSANSIFFMFFSLNLVIAAILSIYTHKIINSLLFAIIVFLMTGGLYFILGATYNGIVQLLIYVVMIPIFITVSIMITSEQIKDIGISRIKYLLFSLIGITLLSIIIGYFLAFNQSFFEIIRTCKIYINPYSDFISISKNILGIYPILFIEIGLTIIFISIGLCHNEK